MWSADWFANKRNEKAKLLQEIEKAMEDFNDQEPVESVEEKPVFMVEEEIVDKKFRDEFKEYQTLDFSKYSSKNLTFDNVIYKLVEKEGPITEELLLKRTVGLFENQKVTSVVRKNFQKAMQRQRFIYRVKDYYTTDKFKPIEMRVPKEGTQPRDILLISTDELASGMRKVVELSVGINKEGLFKTIAGLLGFSRVSEKIKAKLEDALNEQIKLGNIFADGGEYFLKKK